MQVPLLDLKLQYKKVEKEVEEAVKEVLRGGYYILRPNGKTSEDEIAQYCGTKYAAGVASGTDALRISLVALGISKGVKEVLFLPIYSELVEDKVELVVREINDFLTAH